MQRMVAAMKQIVSEKQVMFVKEMQLDKVKEHVMDDVDREVEVAMK